MAHVTLRAADEENREGNTLPLPIGEGPAPEAVRATGTYALATVALSVAPAGSNSGRFRGGADNSTGCGAGNTRAGESAENTGFVASNHAGTSVDDGGQDGRYRTRTCDLFRVKEAL